VAKLSIVLYDCVFLYDDKVNPQGRSHWKSTYSGRIKRSLFFRLIAWGTDTITHNRKGTHPTSGYWMGVERDFLIRSIYNGLYLSLVYT